MGQDKEVKLREEEGYSGYYPILDRGYFLK